MDKTAVLIIGSGGREHALTWALSKSTHVKTLFCAPGNGGTASIGKNINLDTSHHADVIDFVKKNNIGLTIIGPEAPLVEGLADSLRLEGHLVLGVGKKAAQLEGSKIFAKQFMERYNIPTARFKEFENAEEAKDFALSKEGKSYLVVKADGLAAGKGVFVNKNTPEVIESIKSVMELKILGSAGNKIILEETLDGPEVSVIALCDGKTILPFPAAQDHKRAYDNDEGPNTGGMGAYAPTPDYTDLIRTRVNKDVVDNFLRGVQQEDMEFIGVIYFGLMLTTDGPKVLEFNVRFGDPETQVILPLVESDLFEIFTATAKKELSKVKMSIKNQSACTVVMASQGYPGSYTKGLMIEGIEKANRENKTIVFHAGTLKTDNGIVTNGGRVLNVTGVGKNLDQAVVRAYQAVKKIYFKNKMYRKDIAAKTLRNKRIADRIKRMKQRHVKEFSAI